MELTQEQKRERAKRIINNILVFADGPRHTYVESFLEQFLQELIDEDLI